MVIHSSTSGVPRDFVASNGVTSPPSRLTPSRTFRTTRRPDTRVVLGAGLALLSLAALGIGLSQEVPGTQAVLRVTHDVPADAVLQADDISVARVSLPQDVAATTFSSNQVDQVVGQRLVAPLKGGQLLSPTALAQRRTRVASGRIEVTVPSRTIRGLGWAFESQRHRHRLRHTAADWQCGLSAGGGDRAARADRRRRATGLGLERSVGWQRGKQSDYLDHARPRRGRGGARLSRSAHGLPRRGCCRDGGASAMTSPDEFPRASLRGARLLTGLSRAQERRLRSLWLEEWGLRVVARCGSAAQLLDVIGRGEGDVVLVDEDLHRFDSGHRAALWQASTPLVALVREPQDLRWRDVPGLLLPLDAEMPAVLDALERAAHGERASRLHKPSSGAQRSDDPDRGRGGPANPPAGPRALGRAWPRREYAARDLESRRSSGRPRRRCWSTSIRPVRPSAFISTMAIRDEFARLWPT